MEKCLSFCSRSWKIFPERSGTYTSGAGQSSSPQLSIGKEKRAASDARLLPTSSFDRVLCFLSLAMLTPHAFIHLIHISHLFRLVLLILCNLLRGGISFQESRGQPSLPILRQQVFALGEVLTAKIAAVCHPHLGCQPHLGAALCVLHRSPPAGHYYSVHFFDDVSFGWPFGSQHVEW